MRAECPIATSFPRALIWGGCPLAAAHLRSQLSKAGREQSPGHSLPPCRLDTFLQLLREAKSQESTCCFTYSCQRGRNRLNPGCCQLPIPCCCRLLSCAPMQHQKADTITPQADSDTISAVLDSSFVLYVSRNDLMHFESSALWLLAVVPLLPCLQVMHQGNTTRAG